MIVLGVDPGITGGIAVVDSVGPKLIAYARTPVVAHRGKKLVDPLAVTTALACIPMIDLAVIEQVHAMPRQGVSSSFTFGRATGAIEAVASILTGGRVEWVTPNTWKKHFGLGSSKQDSLDAAHSFWPIPAWKVKAAEGPAEATLIARWYIDKYVGRG